LKKQTGGTRRRTLRADPDVESGFKELIMLKRLYHTLENALRHRYPGVVHGRQLLQLRTSGSFSKHNHNSELIFTISKICYRLEIYSVLEIYSSSCELASNPIYEAS
jgi:hypothetical protein